MPRITIKDVREFWESNRLSAAVIPFEPGTREFYTYHSNLRNKIDTPSLQQESYKWNRHPGKKVLEIGCGTGFVAIIYARGGAEVGAINVARRSIDLTRKRVRLYGFRARLQQGSAEHFGFEITLLIL